jgi:uncharacterized protein
MSTRGEPVKPSYYNYYIPFEGQYILYNTLSGAILVVDEETKTTIENIQKTEIPEAFVNKLREHGLILEDNENELLKIRELYNELRYDLQRASFAVAPTARCNLACDYCIQRVDESLIGGSDMTVSMSESTLENALLFIKQTTEYCKRDTLSLAIYGGEPLMEQGLMFRILSDLQEWCDEHSLDLRTGISTNCTLVSQPFIDELNPYTIDFFRTTLDGPQEINDRYRHYKNGKGTYEEITAGMKLLMENGHDVRVEINANRQYKRLPELYDDLKERGLGKVKIRFHPIIDSFITIPEAQKLYGVLDESFPLPESQMAVPYKEISNVKDYFFRVAHEKGFDIPSPALGIQSAMCRGKSCYHYLVDPSGDVYGCVGSMFMRNLRIGHIHENGRFERYPFFYEWMDTDPTHKEKCSTCKLLPSCGGGCQMGVHAGKIPCFCEVSFFPGEEYIKAYVEDQRTEQQLESFGPGPAGTAS